VSFSREATGWQSSAEPCDAADQRLGFGLGKSDLPGQIADVKEPEDKNAGAARFSPVQVVRVAGLVDYQTGSVVSREILKVPNGRVTVFAFDADEGLSEHTSPFNALVQVLEGEVEVTIAGKPFRLAAGEMILMPAHQPHALKAQSRFKMILTMLRS
jgi:quercetin dioxygenase-like cupin family protein